MEPKQIYVTKRNPSYSVQDWGPRWRRHGRLARNMELWAQIGHYEQCRVLPSDAVAGTPLAEAHVNDEYDGVGLVWFRSHDAVPAAMQDPRLQELLDDELVCFAGPIADAGVFAHEIVFRDTGATQVKIVTFIRRKEGLTREQFLDHWENTHAGVFLGVPEIDANVTKYVQNHVIEDFTGVMGDRYDGVVEIGFASIDDIAPTFTTGGYMEIVKPDEQSFLDMDDMIIVITDEVLLYEDALGHEAPVPAQG